MSFLSILEYPDKRLRTIAKPVDRADSSLPTLLDDMYRIAEDNQCLLETSFHEPATDTYWD